MQESKIPTINDICCVLSVSDILTMNNAVPNQIANYLGKIFRIYLYYLYFLLYRVSIIISNVIKYSHMQVVLV